MIAHCLAGILRASPVADRINRFAILTDEREHSSSVVMKVGALICSTDIDSCLFEPSQRPARCRPFAQDRTPRLEVEAGPVAILYTSFVAFYSILQDWRGLYNVLEAVRDLRGQ